MTSPYPMIGPAFCGAAGLLYTDSVTSMTGGKTVCSEFTLVALNLAQFRGMIT
jgi:hypothetical protein